MQKIKNPKGYSMVEILICTAIIDTVMVGIGYLFSNAALYYSSHSEQCEIQQDARKAIELIGMDIKGAKNIQILPFGGSNKIVINGDMEIYIGNDPDGEKVLYEKRSGISNPVSRNIEYLDAAYRDGLVLLTIVSGKSGGKENFKINGMFYMRTV